MFHTKDFGVLKHFLGIDVYENSTGISLCQWKYALEIIYEVRLPGAMPISTPMEPNHQLAKSTSAIFHLPDRYWRLIGKLIYLTLTCPELACAVHTLAQFMQSPRIDLMSVALRVVWYLKESLGQGIPLRADSLLILIAYCDSDWASCPITRRSITGYFVSLGGSPILKMQKTTYCLSLIGRSRVHVNGRYLMWIKVVSMTLSWFFCSSPPSDSTSLWQSGDYLYCY